MNKDKFLEKLKLKLDILEEKEREDIIFEYSNHVDLKIKDGKSEEEAVRDFGDIDLLANEILKAYKVNVNKKSKFELFFNKIKEGFNDIFSTLENENKILSFLGKILIIFLILLILKIPFDLVFKVVNYIFSNIFGGLGKFFVFMFRIFLFFVYIFSVVYLIRHFNLLNRNSCSVYCKQDNSKNKSISNLDENTKSFEKTEKKEAGNKKVNKNSESILKLLLKIFLIFTFAIPVLIIVSVFAFLLGIIIVLFFKGVFLIGLFLIFIGVILISIAILNFIFKFNTKKGDR